MTRGSLITALIFVVVNGQNNHILEFDQTESSLRLCIENNFDVFEIGPPNDGSEIVLTTAWYAAKTISGRTIDRQDIKIEAKHVVDYVRYRKYHNSREVPWNQLQQNLLRTLLDCSLYSRYMEPSDQLKYTGIYFFAGESPEFAAVLEYALVYWPVPLDTMIRTRKGRALLRGYAEEAREMIYCTLNTEQGMSVYHFRVRLRALWMRRAQMYFDGRNKKFPNPVYRYTIDRKMPHTVITDDIMDRKYQDFIERNPQMNDSDVRDILSIHKADRPSDGEYDIFDDYEHFGMGRAEYYIERQLDQLYRIVFYIQELQASGIWTDEEDVYEGAVPYEVMSESLQAIIYDDAEYGEYLSSRREIETTFTGNSQVEIRRELGSRARVWEEYLILLLDIHPLSSLEKITTTTSKTTTTTVKATSTTIKYPESKKGAVCKNSRGKCFIKRERLSHEPTFPDSCCCSNDQPAGKISSNLFTESCLKNEYNYFVTDPRDKVYVVCDIIRKKHNQQKIEDPFYGYIMRGGNPNQLLSPTEEGSVFMRLLSGISATFGGSRHPELCQS